MNSVKLVLAILLPTLLAIAGTDPSNVLRLGNGSTSGNKRIILNRGSSNPEMRWNESTGKMQVSNDGTTFSDIPGTAPDQSYELTNLALATSEASNALTITLQSKAAATPSASDPVKAGFRSATLTTGTYAQVSVTAATTLVISSGSTLGHVANVTEPIYVYLINNAGTAELAASTSLFDTGTVASTTAEGGAGAADSRTAIYSTTARTNVALRLVGRLSSTQATAGTWVTAIAEVSPVPFEKPLMVEKAGPLLVKKQGSSNTVYLQKNDRSQNYPVAVSADTTSTSNGLMIVRGRFTGGASPAIVGGEGFTISGSNGNYQVIFSTAFADIPSCSAVIPNATAYLTTTSESASSYNMQTTNDSGSSCSACGVSFVCVGQRP